tara:strand:+ start:1302 stop:1718 length:417 start_codon:yes stop_codon:yes gene_type:complete
MKLFDIYKVLLLCVFCFYSEDTYVSCPKFRCVIQPRSCRSIYQKRLIVFEYAKYLKIVELEPQYNNENVPGGYRTLAIDYARYKDFENHKDPHVNIRTVLPSQTLLEMLQKIEKAQSVDLDKVHARILFESKIYEFSL